MPNTTNFNWTTPADTDLVKDGALAIRTLANGIDTSLVDLKGGTTGQILSKATNADLDYTWINNDQGDITAVTAGTGITGGGTTGAVTITNDMATTITASGDIVVGTGNATYDNLPIGTTGQVLTADTTVSPYKVKWATAAQTYPTTAEASVTSEQDTTSTSYTDLTTSGPAVTVTTGTKALVIVTAMCRNSVVSAVGRAYMSYAVSGATTIAASDQTAIKIGSGSATPSLDCRFSAASLVTLTAGSNTFTAKYRVTADTGRWNDRTIFVMNLA